MTSPQRLITEPRVLLLVDVLEKVAAEEIYRHDLVRISRALGRVKIFASIDVLYHLWFDANNRSAGWVVAANLSEPDIIQRCQAAIAAYGYQRADHVSAIAPPVKEEWTASTMSDVSVYFAYDEDGYRCVNKIVERAATRGWALSLLVAALLWSEYSWDCCEETWLLFGETSDAELDAIIDRIVTDNDFVFHNNVTVLEHPVHHLTNTETVITDTKLLSQGVEQ